MEKVNCEHKNIEFTPKEKERLAKAIQEKKDRKEDLLEDLRFASNPQFIKDIEQSIKEDKEGKAKPLSVLKKKLGIS